MPSLLALSVLAISSALSAAAFPADQQQLPLRGYDYGLLAPRAAVARADATTPVITGILGAPGLGLPPTPMNLSLSAPPPARKEVRVLHQDAVAWNLYMLGLSMLQWEDQSAVESWFQISGIHAVPFEPWNDVKPVEGGQGSGYCPHTSVLFPTWHRPYMALFEQNLHTRITRIASLFPNETERAVYTAAAATFRMPYWDFAMTPAAGGNVFADEFRARAVGVYGPAGWQAILNPLYSYPFHPVEFLAWNETMRAPSNTSSTAVSDNDAVVTAIAQAHATLQQRVYTLFSNYPRFVAFGNKRWTSYENLTLPSGGAYDSIESVHDSIHMVVGQRGHMEYIWYSAYEPVFWLHHAAVDRLVAMWQQLYPDSWVEPCPAAETTFNTLQGELQDASTLLTPFRSDAAGGFWDSDTARDVTSFGYTYEDLHLEIANVTERKARVTAVVNALYGRGSLAGLVAAAARFKASSLPEGGHPVLLHPQEAGTGMSTTTDWEHEPDLAARLSASAAPLAVLDKHTFISDSGTYTEWVANMRVLDGALGGPFSIHFFLGRVPASSPPLAYPSARNLVGTMSVFAMASPSSPRNVTSTVPLTSALVRLVAARQLATLDEADVVPYLQGKLVYRIVNGREEVVQPTAEMGLWIAVAAATVEAPRSEGELPRWGEQRVAFVVAG